jgi:hypothetical protein
MDPRDGRGPTAELTALAAHLRRISDRVGQVASAHTELANLVSERLAPELTALRNYTGEQLAVHAAQSSRSSPRPKPDTTSRSTGQR